MSIDSLIGAIDRLLAETESVLPAAQRNKKINEILDLPADEITVEMLLELRKRLQWALDKSVLIAQTGDSPSQEPTRNKIENIHSHAKQILGKLYE
jgi:hypothetical protein